MFCICIYEVMGVIMGGGGGGGGYNGGYNGDIMGSIFFHAENYTLAA